MNYDLAPSVYGGYPRQCSVGVPAIAEALRATPTRVVVIEAYPGVRVEHLRELATQWGADTVIDATAALLPHDVVARLTYTDLGEDPVFGRITRLQLGDFFDGDRIDQLRREVLSHAGGLVAIVGTGASLVYEDGFLVYADMPRREATLRQRRGEVGNLGMDNAGANAASMYKRSYFVDWRVADRHKKSLWPGIGAFLDTTHSDRPKLVAAAVVDAALRTAARRPFRVVPYFDPAPWGGEWIQDVCGTGADQPNMGWCFDCVPEENSLLLSFGAESVEIPSVNLVFREPRALLGEAVYASFGDEFPIRTDFLDTMGGGNLSLQVHPLTTYIRDAFGMAYTQDESYYVLDARDGAQVHLGVRDGVDRDAMAAALTASAASGVTFEYQDFVNSFAARKHDHFLIPAGTLHGSGANTMVLEISATPYIFTFKMYDWLRPGLDGNPRPLHIQRGLENLVWERNETYCREHLINAVTPVTQGDGWSEERTGLHAAEFIETRRHWFSRPVIHACNGGVAVINLVEGEAAAVDSPSDAFEPFPVNYAETFIIPAAAGDYRISPVGAAPGGRHATIKAYVR